MKGWDHSGGAGIGSWLMGSLSVWEHSPITQDLTPWQEPWESGLLSHLDDF